MARALVSILVVGWTAVASAQSPEGTRLFDEGRALAKEGKYAEACERFAQSLELDPAVGTKLNLADCNEKLGRNAQAYQLFTEAAEAEKTSNPERANFARGRAAALLSKLGTVIVKVADPATPGLAIKIAGRSVTAAAEIRDVVEPGDITIEATATTGAPFTKNGRADAGATLVVEIPAFAAAPVVEAPRGETARRRSRVYLSYALGGIGIASLTTGILLGLKANGDYDDQFANNNCMTNPAGGGPLCNSDGLVAQNDAITLANIGTGFGVGGLVLIAGGAVVFFTAPRDVVVTPTVTAQSAGINVVGRF